MSGSSDQARPDVVTNVRIAVSIVVLFAGVSVARYVFGFSAGVAIMVGSLGGYILSMMIARYALPRFGTVYKNPHTSQKVTWYWLIWIVPCVLILHFGAHFQWSWSCCVMAVMVVVALVLSLRTRS